MNYIDFIRNQVDVSVKDAIEILMPIYLRALQWNPDSNISKTKADKIQFVEDLIVRFVEKDNVTGVLKYENVLDRNGNPCLDIDGEPEILLHRSNSHVNSNQLLNEFYKYLTRLNYNIPAEIKELRDSKPSVTISDNKCNAIESAEGSDGIPDDIASMAVPMLRKKVVELSNEKIKWDKSITAALRIGLQIQEKNFPTDTSADVFVAEFANELSGLPKTTMKMIYKSLPPDYRNIGGSPVIPPKAIDDETLDTIIETAVAAGLIYSDAEFIDAKELEQQLASHGFGLPQDQYLKAISGACKRVSKQINQSLE